MWAYSNGLAIMPSKSILHHAAILPISTLVKLRHKIKALAPIDVTELGMVTEVKPLSELHKRPGILVTVLPKLKFWRVYKPSNGYVFSAMSSQLTAFQFTVTMPEHPLKAASPHDVRVVGMVTVVNAVQLKKAYFLMTETVFGIVKFVILEPFKYRFWA